MSTSGSRQAGNGRKGSHRRTDRAGGRGTVGVQRRSVPLLRNRRGAIHIGVKEDHVCIGHMVFFYPDRFKGEKVQPPAAQQ